MSWSNVLLDILIQ